MQFQLNPNKFSGEFEKLILKFTYKWKGIRISKMKRFNSTRYHDFQQSNHN